MPLIKGKSEKSFVKNLKTELEHRHPMKQSLAIAYAMKRKSKKMAEGGPIKGPVLDPVKTDQFVKGFQGKAAGGELESGYEEMPEAHVVENEAAEREDSGEEGIVDRIMKRFSKGGQVANATPPIADEMPNEFDDLVLDDTMENSDTGANSGDELGDAQEDEDRKDIVARIMSSRRKKDKLPNPA